MCDAARFPPELVFPETLPLVMLAERTFREKATANHVHCRQERQRGKRLPLHWPDIARLDDCDVTDRALADHALASLVAHHKTIVFPEKAASGDWIDCQAAVSEGLHLVPTGAALTVSADDYERMLADGMLHDEDEAFERLVQRCAEAEARANGLREGDGQNL